MCIRDRCTAAETCTASPSSSRAEAGARQGSARRAQGPLQMPPVPRAMGCAGRTAAHRGRRPGMPCRTGGLLTIFSLREMGALLPLKAAARVRRCQHLLYLLFLALLVQQSFPSLPGYFSGTSRTLWNHLSGKWFFTQTSARPPDRGRALVCTSVFYLAGCRRSYSRGVCTFTLQNCSA